MTRIRKCLALLFYIVFLILVSELFVMDKFLSKKINWRKSSVVSSETNASLPTVNSLLDNTTVFATLNVVPHNNFDILTALTSTSSSTGHPVTTPTNGHVSHSSYTSPRGTNTTGVTVSSDPLIATKVLCISFIGRLGNQLFQYASVLGIALRTKRIPVYLGETFLSDVLRNTSLIDASSRYAHRCEDVFLMEEGCCKFFTEYFELNSSRDYRIGEYLQSWRYFTEHEAEVRHALTFKDTIVSQAQQTVDSLRQKFNRTLTGIHVRRGDYLIDRKTAPVEYLLHAMDYVRKRFREVVFVVSSDDLEWCSQQLANESDVTLLQHQSSPAVDMMILASLDHMIMTVGTYGWWASFLNPGITVYYRDFVDPDTDLATLFNPNGTDYYRPDWISLS
ncbi:galactoside 2-alpha-L-fucosyltransferase 2-like [Pomacea canaliculata]|uniref:galactoside 2-alpha-L-fucosyltransferase 2-like n=1 Tax=Pomacea canaliculata TaxID=400727 RepID=UPI000D730579|nr:galactoside 2-alpha-L-fucosyltransferase 2-like [Pomacea canaliculata]XP_025092524.1 galactoside 2-alpha-L-fucosyltransferase 2-like [Pomacea canaliculata]